MKKGVPYIRVSKARDNMITDDTQLEKIKQYCLLHNIVLGAKYIDLDYSGRSTSRPDFQRLFHDIKTGKLDDVDYILVYKLDRFARSVKDFHQYMEILDEHNINFVSITQQFDTSTPMGRLIRNILVDFAQFESEMVGERVRDNMIQNARNGVWNGGPVPLGFDLAEDEESPNIKPNTRAEDIIMFYKWYLEPDGSIRNNVLRANESNILSSTGHAWNPNQMGRILKNPIYCIANEKSIEYFESQGIEILNKESVNGKKGFIRYNHRKPKGTTSIINDKNKWIIAVGEHGGIVPSDLFIKVQKKLNVKSVKPARSGTGKSLLAWLTKCGKCGKAMTYSYTKNGKGKRYNYYRCRGEQAQGKSVCEGQSVRAEELEKAVLSKLSNVCNNFDFLKESRNHVTSVDNSIVTLEKEKKNIQSKINKIDQEEANLINNLKNSNSATLLTLIEKQIEELENEKEELVSKLEDIEFQLSDQENIEYNKKIVLSQLKQFNDNFDEMSFKEKRQFLQSIIERIIYNEGEIELKLFFGDDLRFCDERATMHTKNANTITINTQLPEFLPPEQLDENTIGQRIKKARLIKGWTIKKLSEESEAAETSISRYERGLMTPTNATLVKLSSALDVKYNWLK